MLDLGGVPIHAAERTGLKHMVMVGGGCMCNIEPMADFFDLCFLGEGEDVDREVLELYQKAKREGWDKPRFLREAAQIEGVYIPSLYDVSYNADGTVAAITPKDGAPGKVRKRIVEDFDACYFPTKPVVPASGAKVRPLFLTCWTRCMMSIEKLSARRLGRLRLMPRGRQ